MALFDPKTQKRTQLFSIYLGVKKECNYVVVN